MSDDKKSASRPFGQPSDNEERPTFGSRSHRRSGSDSGLPPNTPYHREPEPPPQEPAPEPESDPESEQTEPEAEQDPISEEIAYFEEIVPEPFIFDPAPSDEPLDIEPEAEPEEIAELPGIRVSPGVQLKGRPPRRQQAQPEPTPVETESYQMPAPDPSPRGGRLLVIRFGVLFRSIFVMFLTSAVIATLFTWWTPNTFLPQTSVDQLAVALATQSSPEIIPTVIPITPTTLPALRNIGIVSGHRGLNPGTGLPDPGSICEDGLTEQQVTENVANQVVSLLQSAGYTVDLLDEFDERLDDYQALALVSIHADSCTFINDLASGYKVASFEHSTAPEEDDRLVDCLSVGYAQATGLSYHPSITFDMTRYHTFREISPGTPSAIIEIGFLFNDRAILTGQSDRVAQGVVDGILCYLEPSSPPTPSPDVDEVIEPTATSEEP